MDGYLRAGCLLTIDPEDVGQWHSVARSGVRSPIGLDPEDALNYAQSAATKFGVGEDQELEFDKSLAVKDTKKKTKEQ